MSENRQNILTTACLLFSQRGYDAVGIQEIVDEVGVTKPSLYHHFGSKQGLLIAIFDEFLLPFNQSLAQKIIYRQDLQTSLRNIFQLYLDFSIQNPRFFRLWVAARLSPVESTPYQVVSPYTQDHQSVFNHFFQQVSAHHGNMRGRENILAFSFQGLLFSYTSMVLQREINWNPQQVNQVVHQYMHGIFS